MMQEDTELLRILNRDHPYVNKVLYDLDVDDTEVHVSKDLHPIQKEEIASIVHINYGVHPSMVRVVYKPTTKTTKDECTCAPEDRECIIGSFYLCKCGKEEDEPKDMGEWTLVDRCALGSYITVKSDTGEIHAFYTDPRAIHSIPDSATIVTSPLSLDAYLQTCDGEIYTWGRSGHYTYEIALQEGTDKGAFLKRLRKALGHAVGVTLS